METVAPNRKKRRGCRWVFWTVGTLFVLPFIGLGLSNVCLNSKWCRGKIERKIQGICGLEAHIGGASWSPWNGATLYSVQLLQPPPLRSYIKQPMVSADRLNVMPLWKAWLGGRRSIASITMDSPSIVLAAEVISSSLHLPVEPEFPEMAGTSSNQPPHGGMPTATGPAPAPTGKTVRGPSIFIPPGSIPEIPEDDRKPVMVGRPTSWLNVRNASFRLVSAESQRTLMEVSGTTGSIPFAGNPAESSLRIAKVAAFDQVKPEPISLAFTWRSPVLSLVKQEVIFGSQKVAFAARMAKLPGLPFLSELQVPGQSLASMKLPMGAQVEARYVSFRGRLQGALTAPSTWQGNFLSEVNDLKGQIAGRSFEFDQGRALTILRKNVLSCLDARLEGEQLSLMGNATLLGDGRAAGVLRFVAAPESIQAITGRLFPDPALQPVTSPLGTPQRVVFDLHTFGHISDMYLQLGQNGPLVRMNAHPPAR